MRGSRRVPELESESVRRQNSRNATGQRTFYPKRQLNAKVLLLALPSDAVARGEPETAAHVKREWRRIHQQGVALFCTSWQCRSVSSNRSESASQCRSASTLRLCRCQQHVQYTLLTSNNAPGSSQGLTHRHDYGSISLRAEARSLVTVAKHARALQIRYIVTSRYTPFS